MTLQCQLFAASMAQRCLPAGRPHVLRGRPLDHTTPTYSVLGFGVLKHLGSNRAMAKPARKANGQGRAALQKKVRQGKAKEIAKEIWERLDADLVDLTGNIFPRGTTRKKAVHALFWPWIGKVQGRVFTWRLCCSVCRQIIQFMGHAPPRRPDLAFSAYIGAQAERLRVLVRAVKKKLPKMDARDPSTWDTQAPWAM